MRDVRWTRRSFLARSLALAGAAFAGGPGLRVPAAAGLSVRVGYVAPARTGQTPVPTADAAMVAGDMGRFGAQMAADQIDPSGEQFLLLLASAPDARTAAEEARRLVALEKVSAIVGGFGEGAARVLADLAERHGVVFCNVGATSDLLRNAACRRHAFHVEASAAMYLDALAEWFAGRPVAVPRGSSLVRVQRRPVRTLFAVAPDSPEGRARHARALRAFRARGWRGREVGRVFVRADLPDFHVPLRAIRAARPELVLVLLDAAGQLDFVDQAESDGLAAEVCGFPDAPTQTYSFLAAALGASRRLGTGVRAALWDYALPASEAVELNRRFREEWGRPMEGAAWASWAALQIVWGAALRAGSADPARLVRALESPGFAFDGRKGVPLSFRPWDHQLRQPIYLIRTNAAARHIPWDLTELAAVVPPPASAGRGSQPALDRLGDPAGLSGCRFG
jgi:ABC-type branched-subunit amino acid transport system substrate-binding protein